MILCPDKNRKEWRALVDEFGEKGAYVAFFRSGNEFPGVEKARTVLATKAAAAVAVPAAPASAVGQAPPETPAGPVATPPVETRIAEPVKSPRKTAAESRISAIDRELRSIDNEYGGLHPRANKSREVLNNRTRELREERLDIQAKMGIEVADRALMKYRNDREREEIAPDQDARIRDWTKKQLFPTLDFAKKLGINHIGEYAKFLESLPEDVRGKIVVSEKGLKRLNDRAEKIAAERGRGYDPRVVRSNTEMIGRSLTATLVDEGFVPDQGTSESIFDESSALTRIADAFQSPERSKPMPEIVEGTRSIASPVNQVFSSFDGPFELGKVIEQGGGSPTVDFRQDSVAADYGPEDWARHLGRSFMDNKHGGRDSNAANSRIAVALRSRDGDVVLTGLTRPDSVTDVEGKPHTDLSAMSLQKMANVLGGKKVIAVDGRRPGTVEDVVRAGWTPIAVLHFDAEPGKIFRRFHNEAEFDEAWRATEKTNAPDRPPQIEAGAGAARKGELGIQARIDALGKEMARAEEAGDKEAYAKAEAAVKAIYAPGGEYERLISQNQFQAGTVPLDEARGEAASGEDLPFRRLTKEQAEPRAATRNAAFFSVLGRLQNQGAQIDLVSKEVLRQGAQDWLDSRIQQITQLLADPKNAPRRSLLEDEQRLLQARRADAAQAVGVTYDPYHMALAVEDLQRGSMGNLVTLLHEAAEQLTLKLSPAMRGAVVRAIDASVAELRASAQKYADQNGMPRAAEAGAADLLAENLAQKLAAEGIPNHTSLVGSIIRWVKDLYYRMSMAAQAGFKAQPDGQTAIAWYENQLRRTVMGDFDLRLARVLDQYLTEPFVEGVRRFAGRSGTPGGLTDFLDPFAGTMHQPWVEPMSPQALAWNLQFRTNGKSPGAEMDIPEVEARTRQDAATLNDLLDFAQQAHQDIDPNMNWDDFWVIAGYKNDPAKQLQIIQQRLAGAETAKIGGDRMTKVMNDQATLGSRAIVESWRDHAVGKFVKNTDTVRAEGASAQTLADQMSKAESDFRNAALHEDNLKAGMKTLVSGAIKDMDRGLDTAFAAGELTQAVRESEDLLESDPIPAEYQKVFQSVMAGKYPLFDYARGIAQLDLPLADMTVKEIREAIEGSEESTPVLAELAKNKPLMTAMAALARKQAVQFDQIQLGWLRNTEQFKLIYKDLEEIRGASKDQLRQLMKETDKRAKAKGLRERLRIAYMDVRRDYQRASDRVKRAEGNLTVLKALIPKLNEKVDQTQREGAGAPTEWQPRDGAEWTAMTQDEQGRWHASTRKLHLEPDGTVTNGSTIRSVLAANHAYLSENSAKSGEAFYERVRAQTLALEHMDIDQRYPAGQIGMIDRWVTTVGFEARKLGGQEGAAINRRLNQFAFILKSHRPELAPLAHTWDRAAQLAAKSAGIRDFGKFFSQIYNPVNYFLGTNPGLDEGPAIRRAVKLARSRLTGTPAPDFDQRMGDLLRATKAANSAVVRIAEQYGAFVKDPRLKSEFRHAVEQGWLTNLRSFSGDTVRRIVKDMAAGGWKMQMEDEISDSGKKSTKVVKMSAFDQLDEESTPDAIAAAVTKALPPDILHDWLVPFINKGGKEVFSFEGEPISQLTLQDAWGKSGGDPVRWLNELANAVTIERGESVKGAAEAEGAEEPDEEGLEFAEGEGNEKGPDFPTRVRTSILRQLDGLATMESRMAYEATEVRSMFDPMGPKPHIVMDARLNDIIPPEHLQFQVYDPKSSDMLLGHLAFHGAFGRNGAGLMGDMQDLENRLSAAAVTYQGLPGTSRAQRLTEAAARGYNLKEIENAARVYPDAQRLRSHLTTMFGVGNPAGPFNDARAGFEALSFAAGQIVDNPKVGLYEVMANFDRPFAMRSMGPAVMRAMARGTGEMFHNAFGSLLEAFNLHLLHSSQEVKDIMLAHGSATRNLPWSVVMSDMGAGGRFQRSFKDHWFIKPIRQMRYVQEKGLFPSVTRGEREFPRLALLPGFGVLNWMHQVAGPAFVRAQVAMLERMVGAGHEYFALHKEDMESPNFRFKAADLGLGRLDQGVFEWWKNKAVEYNMGTLEDIVRRALPAAAKGDRVLTREQVLRVNQASLDTLAGAASITTTPAALQGNAVLRFAMPLLRWPLWKMHQVHEGLQTADGRRDYAQMLKGLGTLALWNLPMGIAFTFLMDQYDEKLLHKKSMLPPASAWAGVPLVGPFADMATSKMSIPQNLLAYLQRGARSGLNGMGADAAAQMTAPFDPHTGMRQFSLDQRVLAFSQFMNFQQAARALMDQGWTTTWSSFWRPMFMSLGGNGALQTVDIANRALGLDNAESRVVMRINAANWIRSAATENGYEVRPSDSGVGAPTKLGMWIREMQLSAMANDRADFMSAYAKALDEARHVVRGDSKIAPGDREYEAKRRVIASWKSRDPREVLAFKPTPAQMAALLDTMDAQGQADVHQGIELFERYSRMIQPTQEDVAEERSRALTRRQMGVTFRRPTTSLYQPSLLSQ